jgi:AraC-like DNA-binding protein
MIEPSSSTPEIMLGSRPSAAGMLRLSGKDAPEHERQRLFREFFERRGTRYEVEPLGGAPVEIDLTIHVLPGLNLLSARLLGARYRRMRESNDSTDDVGLMLNPGGTLHLSQRGKDIVLGEGEATLLSLTDPMISVQPPPGRLVALRLPMQQLASRLTGAQDCIMRRISRDNPALRLLTSYIDVAEQRQTLADRGLQGVLVSHVYDLIAVTLGATRDAAEIAQGRGLRAARLHALKQDIARNLDQADLSVAALAVRHGCTPRCIQRLFESEGTSFTDYVLAQRLACAHRLLTDLRHDGEKISTIALDAGFGDVSYFNRVFRQRYGDTPSAIRMLARAEKA